MKHFKPLQRSITLGAISLLSALSSARADDYHYRNILIGEQAAGMGGAYIAVSDDPSGIYHNPAGILFSMENYFSLSANTYNYSQQVFKDVFPGKNYKYSSADLVPNFFGFTQNAGKSKWGFAIAVPNSETIDQDDELTDISQVSGQTNTLKRRFFQKNVTYYFGPAFATELTKDVAIGVTLFGVYRTFNRIDNQTVLYNGGKYAMVESSFQESSFGLKPKLGVQYMPMPKVSLGATLTKPFFFSSNTSAKVVDADTRDSVADPVISRSNPVSKPPAPLELGLGGAYFPSKRAMVSLDYYYYTADQDNPNFATVATYNVALGTEVFLNETMALRAGLYTNNSNTPAVSSSGKNQPVHVDQIGATLGCAFKAPVRRSRLVPRIPKERAKAKRSATSLRSMKLRKQTFPST